jgi:phenylalanyl-tRNA synthetase alpha chain
MSGTHDLLAAPSEGAPIPLTPEETRRALALRDLTDPTEGEHAMQLAVDEVLTALERRWGIPVRRHRANPVVPVSDNYDRLGYAPHAVARDRRYSRYVAPGLMLRSHTSAMIPPLLDGLARAPEPDVLLACAGIVYRRDAIDRMHAGEPHQLDLWRVRTQGRRLDGADLEAMIATVVGRLLPGRPWRTRPAAHPYTVEGREIEALDARAGAEETWVEIGECGLAHPDVLARAGLGSGTTGLAMGLGLERLLMVRKGIPDVRLLRSADPRVATQMRDLRPYHAVSNHPPVRRDLSLAVADDVDEEVLGDRVRAALGPDAIAVEECLVAAETPGRDVPAIAAARLGLAPGQKNVLLRLVLRHPDRTLTAREANDVRDRVYAALHEGSAGVAGE